MEIIYLARCSFPAKASPVELVQYMLEKYIKYLNGIAQRSQKGLSSGQYEIRAKLNNELCMYP